MTSGREESDSAGIPFPSVRIGTGRMHEQKRSSIVHIGSWQALSLKKSKGHGSTVRAYSVSIPVSAKTRNCSVELWQWWFLKACETKNRSVGFFLYGACFIELLSLIELKRCLPEVATRWHFSLFHEALESE